MDLIVLFTEIISFEKVLLSAAKNKLSATFDKFNFPQ